MKLKKEDVYDFRGFGHQIKAAREKAKMTREETACKINISPRHLSAIEVEGRTPSANILFALASYFKISLDQFIFDDNKTEFLQLFYLLEQLNLNELDILEATALAIIRNRNSKK